MSLNQHKKRKNKIYNFVKKLLFGTGVRQRKIVFGKARGLTMMIDPMYKFQRLIGLDEKEIQKFFVAHANTCEIFLDVGASDGYYSLLYKKFNASGEAFLFEPGIDLRRLQVQHFQLNKIMDGYNVYEKFVSAKDDELNMSLDALNLQNRNILIKIDVEGNEMAVLNGMQHLLANNNCFLIIETHSLALENACIGFLKERDYTTRIINNAWWRFFIKERRPLAHNRWLVAQKQNAQ